MSNERNLARMAKDGLTVKDTLQDLRDMVIYNSVFPDAILVMDHTASSDGGQGVFDWNATNEDDDDDGYTIRMTGWATAGRWKRRVSGLFLTPEMFGADGGADDSAALLAMAAAAQAAKLRMRLKKGRTYNVSKARIFEVYSGFYLDWNGATINVTAGATLFDSTGYDSAYSNGLIYSDEITPASIKGVDIIGPGFYSSSTPKTCVVQLGTTNTATYSYVGTVFEDVTIKRIERLEDTGYTTDLGFWIAGAANLEFSGNKTSGGYFGARFRNPKQSRIFGNRFIRPGNDASYTQWQNTAGIRLDGAVDVKVYGNYVFACGGTSIIARSASPYFEVDGLEIYGNHVDSSGQGGIMVQTNPGGSAYNLSNVNIHHNEVEGFLCAPAGISHTGIGITMSNSTDTLDHCYADNNKVSYVGSIEVFNETTHQFTTTYNTTVKVLSGSGVGDGSSAVVVGGINTTGTLAAHHCGASFNQISKYQSTGLRIANAAFVSCLGNVIDYCGWGRASGTGYPLGSDDCHGIEMYRVFDGEMNDNQVSRHGQGLTIASIPDPTKCCGLSLVDCCRLNVGKGSSSGQTYYGIYALGSSGTGTQYTWLGQNEPIGFTLDYWDDIDAYCINSQQWCWSPVRVNSHPMVMNGDGYTVTGDLVDTTAMIVNPSHKRIRVTATTGATNMNMRGVLESIGADVEIINEGSHGLVVRDGPAAATVTTLQVDETVKVFCDGVAYGISPSYARVLTGAPSLNANYIGQTCINVTLGDVYVSKSVGSGASDWVKVN